MIVKSQQNIIELVTGPEVAQMYALDLGEFEYIVHTLRCRIIVPVRLFLIGLNSKQYAILSPVL